MSSNSANFPLGPLLSNVTFTTNLGATWTYFVLDIPRGAAGANLHFKLTSEEKVAYEIYVRYGGLPSADIWDFYYINHTNSSDGSMFFLLYNSSKEMVDFYALYAREGTWSFGLRHLSSIDSASSQKTAVSISLERCPKRCSNPHGTCQNFVDESGLTVYRCSILVFELSVLCVKVVLGFRSDILNIHIIMSSAATVLVTGHMEGLIAALKLYLIEVCFESII